MRAWRAGGFVCAAASIALIAAEPSSAQDPASGPGWELGLFSGVMDDRPEFEPGNDAVFRLAHEGLFGGRIARRFPTSFFLEAEVGYAPVELAYNQDGARERHALRAILFELATGYDIPLTHRLQLFARGGLGGIRWRATDSSELDFIFDLGGGVRLFIADRLALRSDLRLSMAPSALSTVRRSLRPELNNPGEVLWLPTLTAGLSAFF